MEIVPLGERLVKVTLAGRLDTPGVGAIETRFLASLVPGANNGIVDLSQVNFMSSLGIRMLVQAANSLRTRKATLAVYGAPEMVLQVFEAVSLDQILPVCSTEAD